MDTLQEIIAWANANEGLLQALALLGLAGGVIASLARWGRQRFGSTAASAEGEPSSPAAAGAPDEPTGASSIAVLPFAAPDGDPEHEFLVDGLAEDLITLLARMPGLFVIARPSTMVYAGRAVDAREIGRDLGVRYLVEGSLRKLGAHVRITARLCETEHGTHLWSGTFDRRADELPALQDELAQSLLARLEPELVQAEGLKVERRPPSDWDAWSYYKRASARLLQGGWNEQTFMEAAELLRQAIDCDSEFALAHANLALLLAFGHRIGLHLDPQATQEEALAAAERALALESRLSEVLGLAGCALADLGFTERGITILERAVATNPSNAQAWIALGAARLSAGQTEAGVEELRHGIRISPQDGRLAVWHALLGSGLAMLGDLEGGVEACRAAAREDPSSHIPRVVLAVILVLLERHDEARASLEEARRLRPKIDFEELDTLVAPFGSVLENLWNELPAAEDAVR